MNINVMGDAADMAAKIGNLKLVVPLEVHRQCGVDASTTDAENNSTVNLKKIKPNNKIREVKTNHQQKKQLKSVHRNTKNILRGKHEKK
jgi:hypothetical protein